MSQPPDERDQDLPQPGQPEQHDTQPMPRADAAPAGEPAGTVPEVRPESAPAPRPNVTQPAVAQPIVAAPAPDPDATQPMAPPGAAATEETTAVWAVRRVSSNPADSAQTTPPVGGQPASPSAAPTPNGGSGSGPAETTPAYTAPPDTAPDEIATPAGAAPIAAKRPVAAPPVLIPALVLAVVLALIGVIGVHDALARAGVWLHGPTWVGMVIEHTNGTGSSLWMSVAGIAVALLGLWLLILAVKPRRRHGLQLQATSTVWLDYKAIASIATTTATGTTGVAEARTHVGRRRVTVDAVMAPDATDDPGELSRRIQREVTDRLAPLVRPPTVRVHLREPAGSDSSAAKE